MADEMTVAPSDFTFITTCKGRLAHLKQSLPRMCAQSGAQVIVVDYSCPDETAQWVKANHSTVKVIEVPGQSGFLLPRARNLGAAEATTPWIMFLDADILLAPGFLQQVLPRLDPKHYFRADPISRQNWGSVICTLDHFRSTGGYDEVYRGWGSEDDDLYDMLDWHGATKAGFPGALVSEIDHGNDLRTRYYDVSIVTGHRINQTYRRMKSDLTGVLGVSLPLEDRQRLYQRAQAIIDILEKGKRPSVKLELKVPDFISGLPEDFPVSKFGVTRMVRSLNYSVSLASIVQPRIDAAS